MRPYYSDEWVTLYHGRQEDVLPIMPDGCADMVLTDPPYNAVNRASGGLRKLDKGLADSEPVDVQETAQELARVSAGSVYVWCSGEQFTGWTVAFNESGLTTRHAVWWKTNPSPMNGEHLWLSAVELCVFGRKPGAYFSEFCAAPVWRGPTDSDSPHPTPKPLWLMQRLVNASSRPGSLVVDPFSGGGTTLLAAKELGRRAIGVEMDERWCEITARRCAQEVLAL